MMLTFRPCRQIAQAVMKINSMKRERCMAILLLDICECLVGNNIKAGGIQNRHALILDGLSLFETEFGR